MRFLFLNQAFYPDRVSSAQHLADLAVELTARGHEVTVLASRRAYDRPGVCFPPRETWRGVRVLRLRCTGFGKTDKWRRLMDFSSFFLSCAIRLPCLRRPDVVVALTSPPLISILGASLAAVRRCRFFYWVMDLNPDEAVAAGWLPQHGLLTRLLLYFSALSLRRAERVVVLDGFMRDRVLARGVGPERVTVLPPWSHDEQVYFDPVGRHRFRLAHGLEHQFVVMYSGNLSPCHPLDTLLAAARALADQRDITFCFIGGGSEFRKLEQTLESGQRRRRPAHCNDESCLVETSGNPAGSDSRGEELPNVVCLPYQPLEELSASLSAADLHVVLMGNDFVGLVHPCKVYNVLRVGAPVLYIGPQPSHVTELLAVADSDGPARGSRADGERAVCFCAGHQEVDRVVRYIQNLREIGCRRRWAPADVHRRFSRATILPLLVRALESESAER